MCKVLACLHSAAARFLLYELFVQLCSRASCCKPSVVVCGCVIIKKVRVVMHIAIHSTRTKYATLYTKNLQITNEIKLL